MDLRYFSRFFILTISTALLVNGHNFYSPAIPSTSIWGQRLFSRFYKIVTPPPTPEPEVDLQQMFSDVFNFRKDLRNDPRFSGCPAPDISAITSMIPQSNFFFGLSPRHRMAFMMIRNIIMGGKDLRNRICLSGILRDTPGINPSAWARGVFSAHTGDRELFQLNAPSLAEVIPNLFLPREVLQGAREQANQAEGQRQCTLLDGRIGSDNGLENLLWYFREDIGVNAFHLNWHLIYPINAASKADRQGELFYFSHHAHLARYHAERLANGLPPVTPLLLDYGLPIEGYNPHLDDTNSGMRWTPRSQGRTVQDTLFDNLPGLPNFISVANQSLLIERVQGSILSGLLPLPDGNSLILDSRTGIDFLGDLIEATTFSVNPDYFSAFGFHNEGHVLIGFSEDPGNSTNLPPGVMAEVATAMRDPAFYRYHTLVDRVFDLHKQLLPPYLPDGGELPLKFKGIEIMEASVQLETTQNPANLLTTFFDMRTVELSRGLDFQGSSSQGSVGACVRQLNHSPFMYRILVKNKRRNNPSSTTVRIFMAPKYNEKGERYSISEQRHIFFMMDLFTVTLQRGMNLITRRSSESSLTLSNNHCGCGWPHNMLLPRGTEGGMPFDLFILLTNGQEDAVQGSQSGSGSGSSGCTPAPIYCGRMNDTYPDARPMGYPFDRPSFLLESSVGARAVSTLEEYVAYIPNAKAIEVIVKHLGFQPLPQTPSQQQQQQPTFQPPEASVDANNVNLQSQNQPGSQPPQPQAQFLQQLSPAPQNFQLIGNTNSSSSFYYYSST